MTLDLESLRNVPSVMNSAAYDLEADLELAARYPHIKCAKYADLLDFHFAVDGSGPLANEWMDKPHRLVYRLTGMLSDLRDARRARDDEEIARLIQCERRLAAIVRWLEANQPDVFSRGLWDAINEA